MARNTDPNKLDRVKKSAMEIIAEKGYQEASIINIAKRANVSTGYLYRHYSSKNELIEDLMTNTENMFKQTIFKDLKNVKTYNDLVLSFILACFDLAIKDSVYAKFMAASFFNISEDIVNKKLIKNLKESNSIILEYSGNQFTNIINHTVDNAKFIVLPIVYQYIRVNLYYNDLSAFSNDKAKELCAIIVNAIPD